MCTLYNTTLSYQALFCLRSKRVATASWLDMSPSRSLFSSCFIKYLKIRAECQTLVPFCHTAQRKTPYDI